MTNQVVVSYSELDAYRQCPLKHQLAYVQRWIRPAQPGGALARGSLWHAVMETHYRALADRRTRERVYQEGLDAVIRPLIDPLLSDGLGHRTEDQELIAWIYDGYVEAYDMDAQWLPLYVEEKFEVPLPDAFGRDSRYRLKLRVDLIVLDIQTNCVWIVDHKSGAALPTQMALEIDDQFGLYQWAINRLAGSDQIDLGGRPIMGTIHNAAKTKQNVGDKPGGRGKPQSLDQRFHRTFMNRTVAELENLAYDAYCAAYNAHPPKSKTRPIYSSPDPRTCSWKCDFKEAHVAARTSGDIVDAVQRFGFVQDFTRH